MTFNKIKRKKEKRLAKNLIRLLLLILLSALVIIIKTNWLAIADRIKTIEPLGHSVVEVAPAIPALEKGLLLGLTMDVHFLDVGQGNCILVKYPNNHFMLVDCGSTSSKTDPMKVNAYINAITGGKDISTIVLTHPDKDHINLVPYLDSAQKPQYVHISQEVEDYPEATLSFWFNTVRNSGAHIVQYPDNFFSSETKNNFGSEPQAEVYILSANVAGDNNTKSIVLSVGFEDINILLTEDATAATEKFILQNLGGDFLKSTVLVFAHHGSHHSSSPHFVKAVEPNVGIFSASAEHKRYGHPRCLLLGATQKMVDKNGKDNVTIPQHRIDCWNSEERRYVTKENHRGWFLTATQGNILFKTDGKNYRVAVNKLR